MGTGGSQSGYEGGVGVYDWLSGGDGELYLKVFNDIGSALTNGDVYFLSWAKDTTVGTYRPTLDACATSATVFRQVVVVNNAPLRAATIADDAWGYVQVRGYCPVIAVTASVSAGELYLQAVTGTAIAATDGASVTNDSFGIAVTAYATGFCTGILFGTKSGIGM
jgi:hypothetical protein